VLIGEVLLLRSLPHAVLVLVFLLLAVAYIRLLDEPQIEARFGDEYRRYRQHVSRLLPRARPWNPDTE
jgi:protein-S-isoprenylcysteine O-methyltransferase Ste14